MTPSAIRDLNWQQLQERVSGLRATVHEALRMHGPCTTRQLAARAGLDILTVRPRVTELCQLGFASEVSPSSLDARPSSPAEGIYRACSFQEAATAYEERQAIASGRGVQCQLF